jgi:hypothetical protein
MQRKIRDDILLVLVRGEPFSKTYSQVSQTVWTRRHLIIHHTNECTFFIFHLVLRPISGQGLLIHEVSRSHTTHHSREESSWRVISSSPKPLPDNTQHSQQTPMPPRGIRTPNLCRRAAAALHFKLHGHWDRHEWHLTHKNTFLWYCNTFRHHLRHLLGASHLTLNLSSI